MSTIRLWFRTDKLDKKGLGPVHLIYQLHGQRKYHNTAIKIRPANWDAENQQAIFLDKRISKQLLPAIDFDLMPSAKDIQTINAELTAIKKEFGEQEADFKRKKIIYSAEMIAATVKEQKQPTTKKEIKTKVFDFIEQYANDAINLRRIGSIKEYKTVANHLKEFENTGNRQITFENIDTTILKQFRNFLIEVKGMNNTTLAKQLSTLKTLLNYARTEYKINVNEDYRDFKLTRKDANHEVIVLTNNEFESVIELDLSQNKMLDKARDIFVFSCATGLRLSDLQDLKREHIRSGSIKKTAVKTNQQLDIPLNAISQIILDKYKELPKPLPIISGQKLNQYLKEVGEKAGIDTPIEKVREYGTQTRAQTFKKYELISIHMGRRTFATLSLERGIATQDVMAMTGHTTYSSFKRYVHVSSERKKNVMATAWGAPKNKLKAL